MSYERVDGLSSSEIPYAYGIADFGRGASFPADNSVALDRNASHPVRVSFERVNGLARMGIPHANGLVLGPAGNAVAFDRNVRHPVRVSLERVE